MDEESINMYCYCAPDDLSAPCAQLMDTRQALNVMIESMNDTYTWYTQLIKPTWAPPSWVFGPVWSVLYLIIAISFGTVFYKVYTGELPKFIAIPFVLNLLTNAAFTPLQFGLKNNLLASIDIVLVLSTLIWSMAIILPRLSWVAYVNIPYLIWVSFATVLQLTILYLNW